MKTPDYNSRPKSPSERTESRQRSDRITKLNLDDYPIEVLEAVLTILKSRSGTNS